MTLLLEPDEIELVAMYAEDFSEMGCEHCKEKGVEHNHDHDSELYLHARCHIEAGLTVAIYKGAIFVTCGVCDKPVSVIKIASREE